MRPSLPFRRVAGKRRIVCSSWRPSGAPPTLLVPCVACRSWPARWCSPPPRRLPAPRRGPAGPPRPPPAAASPTSSRSRRASPRGGPIGPVATRFAVAPAELTEGERGEVRVPHRRARRAGAGADRADAPRRARAHRPAAAGRGAHRARGSCTAGRRATNQLPPAVYDVTLQAIDRRGPRAAPHREGLRPRPARDRGPAASAALAARDGHGRRRLPDRRGVVDRRRRLRASAPAGRATSTRART